MIYSIRIVQSKDKYSTKFEVNELTYFILFHELYTEHNRHSLMINSKYIAKLVIISEKNLYKETSNSNGKMKKNRYKKLRHDEISDNNEKGVTEHLLSGFIVIPQKYFHLFNNKEFISVCKFSGSYKLIENAIVLNVTDDKINSIRSDSSFKYGYLKYNDSTKSYDFTTTFGKTISITKLTCTKTLPSSQELVIITNFINANDEKKCIDVVKNYYTMNSDTLKISYVELDNSCYIDNETFTYLYKRFPDSKIGNSFYCIEYEIAKLDRNIIHTVKNLLDNKTFRNFCNSYSNRKFIKLKTSPLLTKKYIEEYGKKISCVMSRVKIINSIDVYYNDENFDDDENINIDDNGKKYNNIYNIFLEKYPCVMYKKDDHNISYINFNKNNDKLISSYIGNKDWDNYHIDDFNTFIKKNSDIYNKETNSYPYTFIFTNKCRINKFIVTNKKYIKEINSYIEGLEMSEMDKSDISHYICDNKEYGVTNKIYFLCYKILCSEIHTHYNDLLLDINIIKNEINNNLPFYEIPQTP